MSVLRAAPTVPFVLYKKRFNDATDSGPELIEMIIQTFELNIGY